MGPGPQDALATADRDRSDKAFPSACYAPFTSLFLDPHGNVLACCQNTGHPLGNVADASLGEIWRGAAAGALRGALRRDDLSLGCEYCAWQLDEGSWATTLAATFDEAPVPDPAPAWPRRLELAISTTCNLECAMCNGDWSSRIRSRREGRPPLPQVYGEAFFTELRTFLPHLDEIRFLGGEPFVAAEALRVMELLVEDGLTVTCNVQTNGTQWNPRVERILTHLPLSITVSLDGVTRETVESIRVGASYDELMANLARYKEHTDRWCTNLDVAFCFMVQNWHEFGEFLCFADELGARAWVVTVVHPSFSPYHLPADEFDAMLARLEAQDAELAPRLGRNRPQWDAELARLRVWRDRHLAPAGDHASVPVRIEQRRYFQPGPLPPALCEGPPSGPVRTPDAAVAEVAAALPGGEVSVARCDAHGDVAALGTDPDRPGAAFLGVAAADCVGRPWGELAGRLGRRHGGQVSVVREEVVDGACHREVILGDPAADPLYVRLLTYPEWGDGRVVGSVTVAAGTRVAPAWGRRRPR